MDTILNIPAMALTPLFELSGKISAFLPAVVAAGVLLLVGGLAAYWIRYVVDHTLDSIKLDDLAHKTGVSGVLSRLGLGPSLVHLIGVVVHGVIILACVLGAGEALGIPVISEYLNRVLLFLPKLIGVTVVMGGGLFLGDIAGRIVHRCADANRIKGAEGLMKMIHGLVVLFSFLMALEIVGFPLQVITDSMQMIVAAIGLGCAIAFGVAFGMAGRDTAGKWIKDLTPKATKSSEDHEPRMRVIR